MADRPSAPSQPKQASEKTKAEGDRDNERDQPRAAGRDHLDPVELREVLDETSEKHRRGEDIGASGISNPTRAEEQEEQAELPPRHTRKAGGGA